MSTESDPTPYQLVRVIHEGDPDAFRVLEAWCGPSIRALFGRMLRDPDDPDDPGDSDDPERLASHAVRWLMMYLRGRDPAQYLDVSRRAFALDSVLRVGRHFFGSDKDRTTQRASSPVVPAWDHYEFRSILMPLLPVGGDWWTHDGGVGRPLWVFVADVTHHGWVAHLLSEGLIHLWNLTSVRQLRESDPDPRVVMAALDSVLNPLLPEEFYVEALLGRFAEDELMLAGAGNCRVVMKRSAVGRVELHRLGGLHLGFGMDIRDQVAWALDVGDEVVLATDGLWEQPCGEGQRLEARLFSAGVLGLDPAASLHEEVFESLIDTLRFFGQQDDITIITLRRSRRAASMGAADAAEV